MYIPLIILITVLSLFKFSDHIWNFIIKQKKYFSGFLYLLSISSFLYLWSSDNHAIHETWEISLDILWLILFLPILAKVFNLNIAKKLMLFRKELWILMWVLAFVHTIQYYISDFYIWFWEPSFWIYAWEPTYMSFWFIALLFTIVLTITSNNFSLKSLGKYWKTLHKLVYILLIFTILYVLFIKLWWNDPLLAFLKTLITFILYMIWKTLEWKNISFRK